jgi:RNA polymerase sigma-70 factor (ECF subfamily)
MSLAGLSDEALVAEYRGALGARRDSIVEELFSRHYERVARWCYRFTGDRDAAADVAQDVFLKAHRHLDSFRGTSRFTTWLYTIVRNESFNRHRRAGPVPDAEDVLDDLATPEAGPEQLADRDSRARWVTALLSEALDPVERQVFTLHYGEDLSLDAITRLLRLENQSGAKAFIVSAKRKLARARDRLRATGNIP